jgi:hypothetical protein
MRRLLPAIAALAAFAALPASAGTPVLDGKKVTTYAFTGAVTGPQQHVVAETIGTVPGVDDEVVGSCVAPRCLAFPFDVKPARGVAPKTPISAKVTWGLPTTRLWLTLVDVTAKNSHRAECFTYYVTNGTTATVRASSVKPGHRYAVWAIVEQSVAPDTFSGTVSFPAKDTVAAGPVPSPADVFVNGCYS